MADIRELEEQTKRELDEERAKVCNVDESTYQCVGSGLRGVLNSDWDSESGSGFRVLIKDLTF